MVEATPTCSKFFLFLVATWSSQFRGGPLRYLGSASSRAAKIYGDLAKIYGASPQFLATVSGLSFAHKTQRAKSMFSESSQSSQAANIRSEWVLQLLPGGREDSSHRQTPVERPLWTGFPR